MASQSHEGNGVDYNHYLPLSNAARKGDWRSARSFFELDPDAVTAVINIDSQTVIHVATAEGKLQFVKKLLEFMPTEALELRDSSGSTVLHYAAISGNIDLVKSIVRRNPNLPQIRNNYGWTPLFYAATVATLQQKEMLWHLCSVTRNEDPSPFAGALGAELICNITASGFYDISLHLVKRYPHLATAFCGNEDTLLLVMAQRPSAFQSGSQLGFWQHRIYPYVTVDVQLIDAIRHTYRRNMEDPLEDSGDIARVPVWFQPVLRRLTRLLQKVNGYLVFLSVTRLLWKVIEYLAGVTKVRETKLSHINAIKLVKHICRQIQSSEFFQNSKIFTTAIEFGVIELVVECLESFRRLNVSESELIKETSMFHIAVEHRRENIFNLVYGRTVAKMLVGSIKDEFGNTILHLAAKLAPSPQLNSISGAALQMQRELQWFKEVEMLVQPMHRESKNKDGKTARVIFTEEHKDLVEKGEKWMKATSSSCMVAATLIATVTFAAAFTVPGGNQSENGIPIFIESNYFMIFTISDALSLFSSLTSVLMFLTIPISRYAEEDFLYSLPKRLIIGLTSLFISIATMMMAFSAALAIVLTERLPWVFIPISLLACIPVTLFAFLQIPLFVEILRTKARDLQPKK